MINFKMRSIPERSEQPRKHGLTIISDKGMSQAETENLFSVAAPYIDMVKLAFGTAAVNPMIREKIQLYQSHNVPVYFGGLLFEAFLIRNQLDDYLKLISDFNINVIEVSDGAINITHEEKCNYIREFSKFATVISEIGSKDQDKVHITPPYKWIQLMSAELEAGSSYLVAEAKESGTTGIYRDSGEVREGLVEEILTKIPSEKIIWETPDKQQQLYFIKLVGCNANLANVSPSEVIALETMRIGLRSDSFSFYLEENK